MQHISRYPRHLLNIHDEPSEGHSFVYLLSSAGKFKIGITKHSIDKRIKELQTGNHEEIWCRDFFECPSEYVKKVEQMLHFNHHTTNIKNEWFDLSVLDVSHFKDNCSQCIDLLKMLN